MDKGLFIDGSIELIHRKGKKERDYYALVVNLGYANKFLTFDSGVIAELLGILPRQLPEACPLGGTVSVSVQGG